MAHPAFAKLGSSGTTVELEYIQRLGSDFTQDHNQDRAGITLFRYGAPISDRKYKTIKRWTYNANVPEDYLTTLKEFYDEGIFYFYPDDENSGLIYRVLWSGSFSPQYLAPDWYNITFEIVEVV